MSLARVLLLTTLAMLAFAANSLLCRLALRETGIDAASFTTIRLASGALMLWLVVRLRGGSAHTGGSADHPPHGSWASALALFAYAAAFSFAYRTLPAGAGALLLFGAVQATMIGYGLWRGERLGARQSAGMALAAAGLVGLLLPGLSAPPLQGAVLMLASGVAWGVYSLRGRGVANPAASTAGNFLRAVPFALALSLAQLSSASVDAAGAAGAAYAVASGALASGLGYALWYGALPLLRATSAATVQLSVPVLAALGAAAFLGEAITLRLMLASLAVLGGIALVIRSPRRASR
ncbi:hypothetical protein OTERR_00070 [Oryzomicrobium terrae]|uniref:EamA domain-containing protein n=1 Tax=Oryzomicrobium terrae TaxID=1735038 RepID=A0A5C1E3R0_9RHOO|nr:DMT family transporter [Oryzomicrobium terrae]QEL63483.1 hypothetical protein OTERR_00070 [Oryzomicrobium terrae]